MLQEACSAWGYGLYESPPGEHHSTLTRRGAVRNRPKGEVGEKYPSGPGLSGHHVVIQIPPLMPKCVLTPVAATAAAGNFGDWQFPVSLQKCLPLTENPAR